MNRFRLFARTLLAGAAGVLAACGGDDPAAPGLSDLSEAEAEAMFEAFVQAGGVNPLGLTEPPSSSAARSAPQAASIPFEVSIDETVGCELGGSLHLVGQLSGDVDPDDGSGSYQLTFTQDYLECSARAPSDGSVWTFNGAPNVTTQFDFSVDASGAFTMSGSQSGGVAWSGNAKNGTCQLSVAYDFSGSENSFSGSASGSICGVDVTATVDLGG